MGTRIGFVASEKGAEIECDVGLGLRMQKTTKTNNKSISGKKMMTMDMSMSSTSTVTHPHHHHHHDGDNEPSLVVDNIGGFSCEEQQHCGGTSGPLFCNTSNSNTSMGDIYDVASLLIPNSHTFMSYNSSGVMVSSGNLRHNIPNFTASQRQELETQTMIYNYTMASIPVPPQLLIPITKTTSHFSTRSLELGISSNNNNSSDSEPWRCKRTDGKKWRCSRNVVPDQKYCERHSHKTRPRSRKHVELNSHFNTNSVPYSKPSSFSEQRDKTLPAFSATSHDQPRSLEWFMKGHQHQVANSNQEWHQIVHPKPQPQHGLRTTHSIDNNNANTNNNNHEMFQQESQGFFIDPANLAAPSHHQTRRFIDAWSAAAERDQMREIGGHSHRKMPFSSLSLSTHGCEEGNEENAHMGFGIQGDFLRPQWMINNNDHNDTISWNNNDNNYSNNNNNDNGSPPGGPLAEALCLGMAGSSTRESSSRSS